MPKLNIVTDLTQTISDIQHSFSPGSLMRLGDAPLATEVIPTGSLGLNLALGIGGWPRGRVVEIFGPEGSGKTTLALGAIAQAQKLGLNAAFIDVEYAISRQWAEKLGINVSNLLISQPNNGEEALEITEALVRSGNIALVVVDSVAALVPKAELDGDMGDSHVGLQARLMGQAMRKLTPSVNEYNCTVIFINQLRDKVGVMFGNPEITPGGKALKFYSSIRVDVRRQKNAIINSVVVGNSVKAKVVKNKMAPPFREANFDIFYNRGIDPFSELLTLGTETGLLNMRGGGFYSYGELALGRGAPAASQYLSEHPELCQELSQKITELVLAQ